MNWLLLSAAAFALLTTIGHFTVGTKEFLIPMLKAEFDEVSRKIMHCVFHYVSAFLILSTVGLFSAGVGLIESNAAKWMVLFIAANYILNGIWQIALAVISEIPNALVKMFQWVLFFIIAILSITGTLG